MRRWILLLLFSGAVAHALTPAELEAAKQAAADRAAAAAGLDLGGDLSSPSGTPGAAPAQNNGCISSSGNGRISLLGVQSDMGPSTQGLSPATRLSSDHPAMRPLIQLGYQMGLYQDRDGASSEEIAANAAAREQKSLSDFYDEVLGLANWGRGAGERLLSIPDPSAYMERAARAHAAYQGLSRQYAELYPIAEAAGRACP